MKKCHKIQNLKLLDYFLTFPIKYRLLNQCHMKILTLKVKSQHNKEFKIKKQKTTKTGKKHKNIYRKIKTLSLFDHL